MRQHLWPHLSSDTSSPDPLSLQADHRGHLYVETMELRLLQAVLFLKQEWRMSHSSCLLGVYLLRLSSTYNFLLLIPILKDVTKLIHKLIYILKLSVD